MEREITYTAFVGTSQIASGALDEVLRASKEQFDRDRNTLILTFEDRTGRQVDFDLRGTLEEVIRRAAPLQPKTGPGRPKLGVVPREVTLLPRHWEWLEQQPSGASAAIRRLVEQEMKRDPGTSARRMATEATGRFMSSMAGDLPYYEEATRSLYQGNRERFHQQIAGWPDDIRRHTERLARPAFQDEPADTDGD